MSEGRAKVRQAAAGAKKISLVPPSSGPTESHYGLPPGCPVVPLGLCGVVRYYFTADKQIVELPARDHVRSHMLGLFGDRIDYIYATDQWLRHGDDGEVKGIRPERIQEDLLIACSRAGIWNVTDRERGRGAWRGEDNELILHIGDQIMIFPQFPNPWQGRTVKQPGVIGRHVYPAGERVGAPSDIDMSEEAPADTIYNLLNTWKWRRKELDAMLALGWIGCAMIGGALKWRPAIWLTGGKGTGKSSLQTAIGDILGSTGVVAVAEPSPAYIWQTLRKQTLPVAVDELEAEEDNRRAMAVIKLARIAASGGKIGRGGDKHVPVDFTLLSAFVFSSILIPPLQGADRSRLAILDLEPLPIGAPLPDTTPSRLRALGAGLRRQLIDGWYRFDDTVELYRRHLAAAGHVSRGADQFGTLLAAADVMRFGADPPPEEYVKRWCDKLEAGTLAETADDLRDEDHCLQHLLGVPIDPYRKGERTNIGEWINRAAGIAPDWDDPNGARKVLGGYGVRIERQGDNNYVAVANNHSGLCTVFEGTRWQTPKGVTGVWVQALRRLAGAQRGTQTLYFGGPSGKATLIPLTLIPQPDARGQATFTAY